MKYKLSILIGLLLHSITLISQPTIGLIQNDGGRWDGYTLFSPTAYNKSYLIDNCGKLIHEFTGNYNTGLATYLLRNGNLLRTGNVGGQYFSVGGKGGALEIIDWNDSVIWSYEYYAPTYCLHHDVCELPNGNILAIAWERKTSTAAINNGRNPALLNGDVWSEKIIEIQPTFPIGGTIVWEWHLWDHLIQNYSSTKPNYGVIEEHPELLNINYLGTSLNYTEWLHFNSIDYNETLDQILISCRYMCEVYIIDHSTTTSEAAGHTGGVYGKGGDFLYRWGNPEAYGLGVTSDRKFFDQHCAKWITSDLADSNKIIVFNNGVNRPTGNQSSVDIIKLPINISGNYILNSNVSYGPDSIEWSYQEPLSSNFYAPRVCGAQRFPNGNTLIALGPQATIFEIDSNKNKIWEYIGPVDNSGPAYQGTDLISNSFFKATRYNTDFSGFIGHDLTPGLPIELDPIPYECSLTEIKNSRREDFSLFPNPAKDFIKIEGLKEKCQIIICSLDGKRISSIKHYNTEQIIDISELSSGLYLFKILTDRKTSILKLIKN